MRLPTLWGVLPFLEDFSGDCLAFGLSILASIPAFPLSLARTTRLRQVSRHVGLYLTSVGSRLETFGRRGGRNIRLRVSTVKKKWVHFYKIWWVKLARHTVCSVRAARTRCDLCVEKLRSKADD